MNALHNFLYARSPYRGAKQPNCVAFDTWLQEFSQRISYICALETSGKLSAQEAYRRINQLSRQLNMFAELGRSRKAAQSRAIAGIRTSESKVG